MPAVPAMPTPENSSAWKTFSMSRWAMTLPIVARRSPAMTTPCVCTTATMVVPWGASMWLVMPAGRSRRRPGRRSGWCEARKSAKELLPGAKNARGNAPPSEGASMRSPCHEPGLIGGRGSLSALRGVQACGSQFDDEWRCFDLSDGQAEGSDAVAVQIVDKSAKARNLVADVAERLIAEEAEDASHAARLMVVVHVFGLVDLAGRADTTLHLDHRVNVCLTDAVATPQVV